MKKFTRRFYNKKLVALGLSSFMGIGLTSTGFAAWVMSKDTNETPSGNVNVAVITDSSAKIMLDLPATYDSEHKTWSLNDTFSFDAPTTDKEGRIRFGGEGTGEDLSLTISGYLTGNDGVAYDLTAQIAELPAGITNALAEGYLVWVGTDYTTEKAVVLDEAGKFSITLSFKWGDKFGGLNPSVYYDTENTESQKGGKAIDDDTMKTELDAFHACISTGLTEVKEGEDVITNYTGVFKITLSATPSAVTEG